jgi:hypothetical protein
MAYDKHDVIVSAHGDPSVGIPSISEKLEGLFLPDLDTSDERERVRKIFHEAFSELWDDYADVRFEDECPDCYKLKNNCVCIPQRARHKAKREANIAFSIDNYADLED